MKGKEKEDGSQNSGVRSNWKNVGRRKESVHSPQVHLKYKFLSTRYFDCDKSFTATPLAKKAQILYYLKDVLKPNDLKL